jgi:hypothetical protein
VFLFEFYVSLLSDSEKRQRKNRADIGTRFAQCYRKLTAMKYTPYLEQCCQILDAAAEYPTDVYLTASIRVQLFLCRGLEGSSFDDLDGSSAAMGMFVISLQKGLLKFRSSLLNRATYTCKFRSHLFQCDK